MEAFLVTLVFNAVFGVICALIANSKGRSPLGWFFLGLVVPVIALILILCLANLKEEEARRRADVERSQRLREKMRQEQIKNEAFKREAGARLDIHDGALKMDSRQAGALAAAQDPALIGAGPPPIPGAEVWHYAVGNDQRGPVEGQVLRDLLAKGNLSGTTLVWTEGMADWRPAQDVPELAT